MAEEFNMKSLIVKHGKEPDLIVESDPEFKDEERLDCDFTSSYAVFMDANALGGCMVYTSLIRTPGFVDLI